MENTGTSDMEQIGYIVPPVKSCLQLRPCVPGLRARKPEAHPLSYGIMQAPGDVRANCGDTFALTDDPIPGVDGGARDHGVGRIHEVFWRTTDGRWQCDSVCADGGSRMVIGYVPRIARGL